MTRVVMGLLFNSEGKILIAKRNREKRYGGLWEFPGGKIEQGESIRDALTREIREELSAPIVIGEVYPGYVFEYNNLRAEFIPITGSISPQDIKLQEHDEYRFISIGEIGSFSFSPYDHEAIEQLRQNRIGATC